MIVPRSIVALGASEPKRPTPRAFTLLEVLVSLAIFALAAVALSAAYLNVLGGYRNRDRERSIQEAWALVRITALNETDRAKLEAGGPLELPGNQRINWRARIDPTELADLFAVELTVAASGAETWERRERVMVLRPEWTDPADRDQRRTDSRRRLERSRQQ